MKPSEELMLLFELNGYEIRKYKLKKQLEFEDSGNSELYKYKKFADLIVSYYSFQENTDFLHKNPLTYKLNWDKSIVSIDQFIFSHPDLDGEMSIKDLLALEDVENIKKEGIISDIINGWIEEEEKASIIKMENLSEMVHLLPSRDKKHRKPSVICLFISILLIIFCSLVFLNPEFVQLSSITFFKDLVRDLNQYLYDTKWYSILGITVILLLGIYAIFNNTFSRYISDIKNEKSKFNNRILVRWEKDLKKLQHKQSKTLLDYVSFVVNKPSKSFLKVKTLIMPEQLIIKSKAYVRTVDSKYDWMIKHYSKVMISLKTLFISSLVLLTLFIAIGFVLARGLINV